MDKTNDGYNKVNPSKSISPLDYIFLWPSFTVVGLYG